jgi:hypothetical protein
MPSRRATIESICLRLFAKNSLDNNIELPSDRFILLNASLSANELSDEDKEDKNEKLFGLGS